ncbi:MAG: PQQ-binding-like beta-propeller repeat protein [Gemmataceae bacterium]
MIVPRKVGRVFLIGSLLSLFGADWPQHLGPTRDGQSTEKLGTWPAEGPKRLWKTTVGAGFAGAIATESQLFLFHRIENDEVLEAFDLARGTSLWQAKHRTKYVDEFGFDAGPRAIPILDDQRIFAYGPNGDLHAVDRATGNALWHKNLLSTYGSSKGYFGAAGSPIVAAGNLIVPVGGRGASLVAFDPATGSERWKAGDDAASYSSPVLTTVAGQARLLAWTRSGLQLIDPATGTHLANYPFRSRLDASVNAATPILHDGHVFLTGSYGTGAAWLKLQPAAFDEIWQNDASLSAHYNTPVRVGNTLYGVHGRAEGGGAILRAIDLATGKVLWSEPRFGCASLLATATDLLAITQTGELVRFAPDAAKYTERARHPLLDGVVRAAPALAHGRLIVRNETTLAVYQVGP